MLDIIIEIREKAGVHVHHLEKKTPEWKWKQLSTIIQKIYSEPLYALVTHHFSRARIFRQKCWIRIFVLIIYLLAFFLFDGIEKKSESLMRIVLLR